MHCFVSLHLTSCSTLNASNSPIWRHLPLKWLKSAATQLNPPPPKCTHCTVQALNALLVFLQKIEAGVGRVRKPQDRHIGIHSHLSARLLAPAPAGMWTWHWGWNKPASAVATYNGYIQGCIFLQQLHVLGRILLQQPQPKMYILTMVTN